MTVAVLAIGTLVTGTGPNSGDSRAERLSLDLEQIARVHAITVWCFLAITVILAVRLQRLGVEHGRLARWLIGAIVIQGAIGYTQFALGVPPALVEAHIAGSVLVWSIALFLYSGFYDRPAMETLEEPTDARETSTNTVDEVTVGSNLVKMDS